MHPPPMVFATGIFEAETSEVRLAGLAMRRRAWWGGLAHLLMTTRQGGLTVVDFLHRPKLVRTQFTISLAWSAYYIHLDVANVVYAPY
jgi:hypothetical protein